jgi:hypothetical protein
VQFPISGETSTLRIRLKNDFGLSLSPALPALGSPSVGLRVMSEAWSSDRENLMLDVSGAAGKQYEIGLWNPAQVESVEGAELVKIDAENAKIEVSIPAGSDPYVRERITIRFSSKVR